MPLLLRWQMLCGGCLSQIGWFLLGFGMVFFWVFAMDSELITWLTFRGRIGTTQGVVTGTAATHAQENDTQVYAIHYWYTLPGGKDQKAAGPQVPSELDPQAMLDGNAFQGCSYSISAQPAYGARVNVEYLVSDPKTSRIQGLRCRTFGAWACFVGIFPLAGLCMLLPGHLRGRKANRLIECGELSSATLKSKEPTNMSVNDQPVYKSIFEFKAGDLQTYEVTTTTHLPGNLGDAPQRKLIYNQAARTFEPANLLENEPQEKVIYNPLKPSEAVLLDSLPGSFVVDEQGMIHTENQLRALAVLIVPFLTIVGHGTYAVLHYWR